MRNVKRHALAAVVVMAFVMTSACWSLGTDVPEIFGERADASGADVGASGDAAVDGDAGAGTSFCKGRDAALCADFESEQVDAGFTDVDRENGGTLERVPRPDGQGFSLLAKSNGRGDGTVAALGWSTAGRPKSAHVELDMRIESLPGGGSATVLTRFFFYPPNDGYATLDLWGYADKLVLAQQFDPQGPSPASTSTETGLGTGTWRRLALDFNFEGRPHITLRIEGQLALEETMTELPTVDDSVAFELGVRMGPNAPPGDQATVYFDNVVVDLVR